MTRKGAGGGGARNICCYRFSDPIGGGGVEQAERRWVEGYIGIELPHSECVYLGSHLSSCV